MDFCSWAPALIYNLSGTELFVYKWLVWKQNGAPAYASKPGRKRSIQDSRESFGGREESPVSISSENQTDSGFCRFPLSFGSGIQWGAATIWWNGAVP